MALNDLPLVWFTAFCAGTAVILLAGAKLPSLGKKIAWRFGVLESSVGLFGLAVITSLPELAVTISAMRLEAPNLAFANVLGSNNFNFATAGLLSLLYGGGLFLRAHVSRYVRTGLLLSASTVLAGLGVVAGPAMPGALSLLAFSLPIAALFVLESRTGGVEPPETSDSAMPGERADEARLPAAHATRGDILAFLAMSALVVLAGVVVSWSAKRIATHEFVTAGGPLVLGETFVGTLLVAIATSLPEVTVAFSAIRSTDSPDMALGTLMGSNSFNLLVFAVGAPFVALGPTGVVSAWSNLTELNLINV
ncbi:MAG: hypothetical protein GF400_00220, partial [Candidatus Eisenbacteria bacterium]|nr:hypothetical protein [Candidatus Eisenbacteria bacterium]